MRHYFYFETEKELTGQDRSDILLKMVDLARDRIVHGSGYKVNLKPGLAVLVDVGELL